MPTMRYRHPEFKSPEHASKLGTVAAETFNPNPGHEETSRSQGHAGQPIWPNLYFYSLGEIF